MRLAVIGCKVPTLGSRDALKYLEGNRLRLEGRDLEGILDWIHRACGTEVIRGDQGTIARVLTDEWAGLQAGQRVSEFLRFRPTAHAFQTPTPERRTPPIIPLTVQIPPRSPSDSVPVLDPCHACSVWVSV